MNATKDLYFIGTDAAVTPVIGSGVAHYIKHPVDGSSLFNSYDFLAVMEDEDGISSDWLVSAGTATGQMLLMEISAWLITRALGLPVPEAAIMVLTGSQMQVGVSNISWHDIDLWPCFARREYMHAPARVSFTDATLLLATANNRAEALLTALPLIWFWGSNIHSPAEMRAFVRRLAIVAGVNPDLAVRTASAETTCQSTSDMPAEVAA